MAAAAGIFNQQPITAAQALTGKAAAPMDDPTSGSGSSSSTSDSATITANDFLTLLVTEMQNQDPTAQTDPNEYIDQLVQVNSLEQLININQTLTGALDPSSSSSTDTAAAGSASRASALAASPAAAASSASHAATPAAVQAPGNLSVPAARPAALRVAHALDGRFHAGR